MKSVKRAQGQKPPVRGYYPAKDSGCGRRRKHLLTIPTYLRSQGERGLRVRGAAFGTPRAADPWQLGTSWQTRRSRLKLRSRTSRKTAKTRQRQSQNSN